MFVTASLSLACCVPVARYFPCNFVLLTVFTLAAGFMLMVLCARVPPHTVALALTTTTFSCAAIILFASQTTFDITKYIFIIYVASVAVFIFGTTLSIFSLFMHIEWLHAVFSAAACVVFMVYLAVDIQMILGGRKYEMSPEEYVMLL